MQLTSLELATAIAKAMDSKKGTDIRVLKVEDLTILTDYFVIGTGNSSTQVKALADEVEYQLSEAGVSVLRREGTEGRNWILLDYGVVIVHIFYPDTRDFYDLEHLWADAKPVPASEWMPEEAETPA